MSESTASSSRLTPVRRIMSSMDANLRACAGGAVQSCAQRLQKHGQGPVPWISSIDRSSQPHFGQIVGGLGEGTTAAAIARPTGSRRPAT